MDRAEYEKKIRKQKKEAAQPEAAQVETAAQQPLAVQRLLGNRGLQRLLNHPASRMRSGSSFIQAKMNVTAADDQFEREADAVAQQVVRMPAPDVQREGMEEEELQMKRIQREGMPEEEELQMKRIQREGMPEEEELQMKRIQREGMPEEEELQMKRIQREGMPEEEELQMKRIQREGMPEEEELMMKRIQRVDEHEEDIQAMRIQREEVDKMGAFDVDGEVEGQIEGMRGGGQPMSDDTRGFFESRMGVDFGDVRVHQGSQADSLNNTLQAKAFTTGSDIFFKSGEYNPGSDAGKELLGHELTHVVQQGHAQPKREED